MAMDKINGSPLLRQGLLDRFRGSERGSTHLGAPDSTNQPAKKPADKADISDAAHRLVDLRAAVEAGRAALAQVPDVRPEKVAAARERLATGFYQSAEVRQAVAERVGSVIESLDSL
ncbi:MAG: flagellar biosynthesis anti-sigma factor FlgM [bacterium]|nr:flagellar biosynthesis anti-sigma factor FlgM [bacterium]